MSKQQNQGGSSSGFSPDAPGYDLRTLKPNQKGPIAGFGDVDPKVLAGALDNAIDADAFIGIGRVTGGGAICILVKQGVQAEKLYASNETELEEKLQGIRSLFAD